MLRFFLAAAASALPVATLAQDVPADPPGYTLSALGAFCPAGTTPLASEAECQAIATILPKGDSAASQDVYDYAGVESSTAFASGCFCAPLAHSCAFNEHPTGAGQPNYSYFVVCAEHTAPDPTQYDPNMSPVPDTPFGLVLTGLDAAACPTGSTPLASEAECQAATAALSVYSFFESFHPNAPDSPPGCFCSRNDHMYHHECQFNEHATGTAGPDHFLVCAEVGGPYDTSQATPTQCLPECPADTVEAQVNVLTDDFPGETSWRMTNVCDGMAVLKVTAGDYALKRTTYTHRVCVPSADEYEFVIEDSFGDGICCAYGEGSYTVSVGDDKRDFDGDFSRTEETSFGSGCSARKDIAEA